MLIWLAIGKLIGSHFEDYPPFSRMLCLETLRGWPHDWLIWGGGGVCSRTFKIMIKSCLEKDCTGIWKQRFIQLLYNITESKCWKWGFQLGTRPNSAFIMYLGILHLLPSVNDQSAYSILTLELQGYVFNVYLFFFLMNKHHGNITKPRNTRRNPHMCSKTTTEIKTLERNRLPCVFMCSCLWTDWLHALIQSIWATVCCGYVFSLSPLLYAPNCVSHYLLFCL